MAKANKFKFTKPEKSWIMYDWANSVYATNILAVIFPIYFGSVCQAAGADNLVLWSYGTSISTFVVAILAPVLGALADHKGIKRSCSRRFWSLGCCLPLPARFSTSTVCYWWVMCSPISAFRAPAFSMTRS